MSDKKTLQEYADERVSAEYRQPLKTVREACEAIGWMFEDKPQCCGQEAERRAMLGDAYFAQCKACRKFIMDITGPSFSKSGSSVMFIDRDKFPSDTQWERCWIAGQEQP